MQRIISVVERKKTGGLVVVSNREQIKCDDAFTGVEKALDACKKSGATMVMILGEDDSVLRHWTKPEEKPAEA